MGFGKVVSYRNSTSNHNLEEKYQNLRKLYLIEILHQTTTQKAILVLTTRCILSKFYIKPQRTCSRLVLGYCCILSKFYIKPQLLTILFVLIIVVSYRNSTSNHNMNARRQWRFQVVSYRNSTSNHNLLEEFVNF